MLRFSSLEKMSLHGGGGGSQRGTKFASHLRASRSPAPHAKVDFVGSWVALKEQELIRALAEVPKSLGRSRGTI